MPLARADPVGADSGWLLKYLSSHTHLNGAIAQLGERIVRNDEVVGSIPTSSTIFSSTCGGMVSAVTCFVSWFVS
jgi:hypothetical protein